MNFHLPCISLIAWMIVAIGAHAAAPAETLDARVRAGLETQGEVWVGQQVGLTVDILTTGFTFAKQRIHLPEVPGALVLEDAVTTINLGEDIDGQRWQVLRYRYPMFVQRSGPIEVPSIHVAFEVSAGYGRDSAAFDLDTNAISLSVLRPPGVSDFRNLVTTTQFEVDVALAPATQDLQVGDALTRTITRAASGVSGMAFAPLPQPELSGVAIYPDDPLIEDRSNRGELKGERVDTVTFVLQAAGEVTLPAMELQWWDPAAAELHLETIPALTLKVAPNPAMQEPADPSREKSAASVVWVYLIFAAIVVLLGGFAVRRLPHLKQRVRLSAQARAQAEPARFKQLLRACRSNDAGLAYNAFLRWISAEGAPAADLLHAPALRMERDNVQQALIKQDTRWRGSGLAHATRRVRRQQQRARTGASRNRLTGLNPTEASSLSPQ